MFCLSPSWERSQILYFLPRCFLCSHRKQQVPGKRKQLLRLLFAIAIVQWELSRNWGWEVSAWSLTGGSCGIQGRGRFLRLRLKSGVGFWGAAGSMLVEDSSTACREHPMRGLDNAKLMSSKCVALGVMAPMPSAYLQSTMWKWKWADWRPVWTAI